MLNFIVVLHCYWWWAWLLFCWARYFCCCCYWTRLPIILILELIFGLWTFWHACQLPAQGRAGVIVLGRHEPLPTRAWADWTTTQLFALLLLLGLEYHPGFCYWGKFCSCWTLDDYYYTKDILGEDPCSVLHFVRPLPSSLTLIYYNCYYWFGYCYWCCSVASPETPCLYLGGHLPQLIGQTFWLGCACIDWCVPHCSHIGLVCGVKAGLGRCIGVGIPHPLLFNSYHHPIVIHQLFGVCLFIVV